MTPGIALSPATQTPSAHALAEMTFQIDQCGVRKSRLGGPHRGCAPGYQGQPGFRAGVLVSLVYSLLRALLDVIATNHRTPEDYCYRTWPACSCFSTNSCKYL